MTRDGFDVRSLALTLRRGSALPPHDHPWGQLVFARSGVLQVATDAVAWLVPATRAIWLPPRLLHAVSTREETAMRTLYIAPERAATLPAEPAALEVAPLLRELILHILALGMLAPANAEHDRLAGLLVDLVRTARPLDTALPLPRDPRAARLAAHLQAHPEDDRELRLLAGEGNASLRTLQRLFLSETGLTLEAWRCKARMIHAVAVLASGMGVTAAALDCGYRNPGAFISAFTRHFGVTPGRYGSP